MGYYVNSGDTDLIIEADKLDAALAEMKRINSPEFDHLKNGGSYGPEGRSSTWYSWMPEDFEEYDSLFDFLSDVGFEMTTPAINGDLVLGFYDSKIGNEEVFFTYLAPFVKDGSYVEWRGEDGAVWRWLFEDGKLRVQVPEKTVWRDEL